MKPFYFGDSTRPLFGVYHPPHGRTRRAGVVICPPFGQEYLRAHRSLRELAGRLSEGGFHALRFDYHGSGDSAGEAGEIRLDGCVADAMAAVVEVRELAASQRVALIGVRLGGTIGALCANELGGVDALVLWDPVLDGAAYLDELRATHEAWMREHAVGALPRADEALGFPLMETLSADLRSLGRGVLPTSAARRVLVVSSDVQDGSQQSASAPGEERRRFPPAPVWLHAEGMDRVLVPGDLLDAVVLWLGEVLR